MQWYKSEYVSDRGYQPTRVMDCLVSLFGYHNLTSDAEGEEMLMVKASVVKDIYDSMNKAHPKENAWVVKQTLEALFGSKCLPDEGTDCTPVEVGVAENATTSNVDSSHGNVDSLEPKPSEPKFKEGDKVRTMKVMSKDYVGKVGTINCQDDGGYIVDYDDGSHVWSAESDLEPYTEPTANYLRSEGALNTAVLTDKCSSASTCDKQFDNIIKDGFRNHNRLHIAAMAMAGLLANEGVSCFTDVQDLEHMDFITYHAFEYADKLIKKSEEENDI